MHKVENFLAQYIYILFHIFATIDEGKYKLTFLNVLIGSILDSQGPNTIELSFYSGCALAGLYSL